MKNIFYTLALATISVILSSCSPTPIFYHSEADIPYFDRATKTDFKLITDKNIKSSFEFGVIAAKDNDKLPYVLLAPGKLQVGVDKLIDVNLTQAIPLMPNQVKAFIQILNQSIEKWGNKYDSKNGIAFEFMVTPENEIYRQSENVVTWYPSFKYYFQNNEDGPLCTIFFGEGLLKHYYKFDELYEVKDLLRLVTLANNYD